MTVLVIMIPLSLLFVLGAGAAFFWAVNHDQFDDMDSAGLLPMSDDLPVVSAGSEEGGSRPAQAVTGIDQGQTRQ